MGYFVSELPSGEWAEIRWGLIIKKSIFINPFRRRGKRESKRAYIVRIGQKRPPSEMKEYRLLRTMEGQWLSEAEEGFQPTAEDAVVTQIKAAIQLYEQQH